MPVVTQSPYAQSSAVINGQTTTFIQQQVSQVMAGAPDNLVSGILQQVIRDYYHRSGGWVEDIGPYPVMPSMPVISLNPVDQYSQVQLVKRVFLYPDVTGVQVPRQLYPLTYRRYGDTPNAPMWYGMDDPYTLRLYPTPDKNYGTLLYITAQMLPVINAGRLPNISVTHHFDGLLYGTMYRLGIMPNKPWTIKDKDVLREWDRQYRRSLALARDMAERLYGPADSGFIFPRAFTRGSQFPLGGGVGWP